MIKFAQGSKITLALVKFLDYPITPFSPHEYQVPITPCSLICSYVTQYNTTTEVVDKKIFHLKYRERVIEKKTITETWFVKVVPISTEEKQEEEKNRVFEIPDTQIFCPDLSMISGDTVGPFNNLKEIITWAGFNVSSVETNYLLEYNW